MKKEMRECKERAAENKEAQEQQAVRKSSKKKQQEQGRDVMQKLAEICVRRPVFATMLILSLTVVGLFSYNSLGVDLFPKIDLPTITVTVVNPGASPQEIETEITDKVEGAVNTIAGIDELRSHTQAWMRGENIEPKYFAHQFAFNLIPHIDPFGPDG